MITDHIGTWDSGEGQTFSIYRKPDGNYEVWFKIGVAVFQVPPQQLPLTSKMARIARKQIKELVRDDKRDMSKL